MNTHCEITIGLPDLDGYLEHTRLETDDYLEHTRFGKLVKLCPEAKSGCLFRSSLPLDDMRNQKIIDFLCACGMEPQIHYGAHLRPKQFHMYYRRIYDNSDFEAAEFLEPSPEVIIWKTVKRRPDGVLAIKASELRTPFKIASAAPDGLMVSEEMRVAMIAEGLVGVVFKPLAIEGSKAEKYQGRVWELASDRVMPQLSPVCRFVNTKGEPCSGPKDGGLRDEAPYVPSEFHYLRSAIAQLTDFDLACNKEIKTCLVASKRFYNFCVQHKIPMTWRPVRIDPG